MTASSNALIPNNPLFSMSESPELRHSPLWSLLAFHLVGSNVNHRDHILLLNYTTEGFRPKANENVQAQTRTKLSILPTGPFSLLLADSVTHALKKAKTGDLRIKWFLWFCFCGFLNCSIEATLVN